MKPILKVHLTDFWPNFNYTRNFFLTLLSRQYQLVLSPEDPDILIYSCYGADHRNYKCIRIFYTSENQRPDFTACDFAITFDYFDDPRHYRWPLYAYYIDQYKSLDLLGPRTREMATEKWQSKKKFCCMVVSNGHAKKRIDFFNHLAQFRPVDSGGKILNNVGGPVPDKLEFIKDYKFVIAFENSSSNGYTTEKLLEPLMMDCIPVYWGNPRVGEDFNRNAFLNYSDFRSEEELIKKMLEIENDPETGINMLLEPKFPGNKIPESIREENLLRFFQNIIDHRSTIRPVATTFKRHVHYIKRKIVLAEHYLRSLLGRNFR